jgi:hypothetical protein
MAPVGIPNQNVLVKNFAPVQPILTGNTLIDSAQLAETHGYIKSFPTFISEDQPAIFHKKYLIQ